jgi:hypothetical protein
MKKRMLALAVILSTLTVIPGCGSKTGSTEDVRQTTSSSTEHIETSSGSEHLTKTVSTSETVEAVSSGSEGIDSLAALGDIESKNGIFTDTVEIPADLCSDLDQMLKEAEEQGYKAEKTESGGIRYHLSKKQHAEMLEIQSKAIREELGKLAGSETCPNVTEITANDDFTVFTVKTTNAEPDINETFSAYGLMLYGAMYGSLSGKEPENVRVEYVNADSGALLTTLDSKDMNNTESN